jgi:hypothetical protein
MLWDCVPNEDRNIFPSSQWDTDDFSLRSCSRSWGGIPLGYLRSLFSTMSEILTGTRWEIRINCHEDLELSALLTTICKLLMWGAKLMPQNSELRA